MRRRLIAVALVLAGLMAAAYWLAGREQTLQWALARVTAASQGQLRFEGVSGNLLGVVRLEQARFANAKLDIVASSIELDFSLLGLLHRELRLHRVKAASLAVTHVPDEKPLELPEDLTLPIALEISRLEVGRIDFRRREFALAARDLAARIESSGQDHGLQIQSLALPWGLVEAELGLAGRRPFALRGKATLKPAADTRLPALGLVLGGNLSTVESTLVAEAAWIRGETKAIITPFAPEPVRTLDADLQHLELQGLDAGLPQARLVGKVQAKSQGPMRLVGRMEVSNRSPGPLSASKLPLQRVTTAFDAGVDGVSLSDLSLALFRGGVLNGQARLSQAGISAKLTGRELNLSALHARLVPTRLAGKIELDADLATQRLQGQLSDRRQVYAIDATRTGDQVRIHNAQARSAGGEITLQGDVTTRGAWPFSAKVRLARFNPAAFGDFPEAHLNARLQGSGHLQPAWQVRGEATVSDSLYRKRPLSGKVTGQFSAVRISDSRGDLQWGGNRGRFHGSLGRPGDQMDVDFLLSDLQQFLPDWQGQASGQATLSGDWQRPGIRLKANTAQIRGPGQLRWHVAAIHAQLAPDLDAPLAIEVSLGKPQWEAIVLDSLALSIAGSGRQHRADLSVQGQNLAFESVLAGGLSEAWDWQGKIEQFQASKPRQARLQSPASLAMSRSSLVLGAADVVASKARFHVDDFRLAPDGLRTRGQFNNVPLAMLGLPLGKDFSSDALLGGSWQVSAGERLNGMVKVRQESGTWTVAGERSLTLRPTRIEVEAVARDNQLTAQGQLALKNGSLMDAHLTTQVARAGNAWVVPGTAPLSLQAQGRLARLDWLGAFLGGEIATGGSLEFTAIGKGTWARPNLNGAISGKDLRLQHLPSGVAFSEGLLSARLAGEELLIDKLDVKSGPGRLQASGKSRLGANPDLRLRIEGEHLALLEHRDWDLDTHLKGDLKVSREGTTFQGELRVNRGLLLLGGASAPTLSSDVHIKGRQAEARPSAGAALALDLLVDLGNDFQIRSSEKGQLLSGRLPFQTSGLRTKATGKLRLQAEPRQPIRTNGEIRLVDGSYYLLGQRLDIERGNLLFNGPLHNPVLDISAVRETRDLKAGMGITGTAQNPRARLFSEPDVPDQEKLSWLLFGRGGQPMDSSLGGTTSVSAGLTSFGLQLTDRLYVAYEQGTTGTEQFVNFYSKLSDRLSVEARTGSESALRLFYTFTLKDRKPDPDKAGKD